MLSHCLPSGSFTPGALKINVHVVHSTFPLPNDNTGIARVYRDANNELKLLTIGVISGLSIIVNQLWAIYSAILWRALKEGYLHVIIETDNFKAFQVISNFNIGAPTKIYHIANQIDILLHNNTWIFVVGFIFTAWNRMARYTSRLGMDVGTRLYVKQSVNNTTSNICMRITNNKEYL